MSQPVVVIGSSPLLLVRAVELARAGTAVVVVEALPSIGGSWSVVDVGGWIGVEEACHLLERSGFGYERLEAAGAALEVVRPVPSAQLPARVRVPYGSRRWFAVLIALVFRTILRSFVRARWEETWRAEVKEQLAYATQLAGEIWRLGLKALPIRYFVGGAARAQRSLLDSLAEAGGEMRVGARVVRIDLNAGSHPHVALADGEVIVADRIVTGEGLAGARIVIDGAELSVSMHERDHHHLLLATSSRRRQISYLHVPFHDWMHRVTDITSHATATASAIGTHLFLVNLRREVEPDEVVRLLVEWKVIPGASAVQGIWQLAWRSVEIGIADDDRARARSLGLEVIRSHGDLIRSVVLDAELNS